MRNIFVIGTVLSATALAGAQYTFNPNNDTFSCPPGKTAFCGSDSLVQNIIIRCNGTVGQPGNCDDNLDGIPPVGIKSALCWQCSRTSGDAACSYNGVVYPDNGTNFTVAEGNARCNATSGSNSTSSGNSTSAANTTATVAPLDPSAYSTVSSLNPTDADPAASTDPADPAASTDPSAGTADPTTSTDPAATTDPADPSSSAADSATNLAPTSAVPLAPGSGAFGGSGLYPNATGADNAAGAAGSTGSATPRPSIEPFTSDGDRTRAGVNGALIVAVGFAVGMSA